MKDLPKQIVKGLDSILPQYHVPEKFGQFVDAALHCTSLGKIGPAPAPEYLPLVELLGEAEWCDPLGDVYMEIVSHWKAQGMGQYFTPYPVCKLMAQLTMGQNPDTSKPLRFLEPTCGSGANIIAMAEMVKDTRHQHRFYAADLDLLCVKMATVQMALHSIPGAVFHSNTLTLEVFGGYVIELGRIGGKLFPVVREATEQECTWFWRAYEAQTAPENQAVKATKPAAKGKPDQGSLF